MRFGGPAFFSLNVPPVDRSLLFIIQRSWLLARLLSAGRTCADSRTQADISPRIRGQMVQIPSDSCNSRFYFPML